MAEESCGLGSHNVYVFKVTMTEDIWREVEIQGSQSLSDLSSAILRSFNFDDDHLHAFFMTGEPWDFSDAYWDPVTESDYPESRKTDQVKICNLDLPQGRRFLYLFDFGDEWFFEIQYLERRKSDEAADYPRITGAHGKAPLQYV